MLLQPCLGVRGYNTYLDACSEAPISGLTVATSRAGGMLLSVQSLLFRFCFFMLTNINNSGGTLAKIH